MSGRVVVNDYATMAELVAAGAGRWLDARDARPPSRQLPERSRLLHDHLLRSFSELGCV